MGRKRKAGSLPSPIYPSSSVVARPKTPSARSTAPAKEAPPKSDASKSTGKKRRKRGLPQKATATLVPTLSPSPAKAAPGSISASPPLPRASQSLSLPPLLSPKGNSDNLTPPAAEAEVAAAAILAAQSMKPSDVIAHLLHVGGWWLGSCWGPDCNCTTFEPAATGAGVAAATGPVCSCGHRSVAHELVDANEQDLDGCSATSPSQKYRFSRGPTDKAGDTAEEMAVRLRRLFSAIRNARALGHCGLFEDSEGLRGWGVGWFLSRHARRYVKEARQAVAELGGVLHDPPAVARCLAAAEALLSGNATGLWTMPDSLPSTSIYQALGTGIASELDLAYWHARYTAASRFNAGGVTACALASVVPPPEVYFVCLAFHMPSFAELQALPGMGNSALRNMLAHVFDLPVDAEEELEHAASPGSSGRRNDDEIHFPVLTNPLMAVAQSTWLETAISADAKSWVPHFPPRFGEPEGTMRGSDPGLPPPIRARCDATRDWSARLLAFAVPNRRAVGACRRAMKACGGQETGIVEVGAGLGYWKWVLEGGKMSGGSSSVAAAAPTYATASLRRTSAYQTEHVAAPLKVLAIDKDPSNLPSAVSTSVGGAIRDLGGRGHKTAGRKAGVGRGGGGGAQAGRGRRPQQNAGQGGPPVRANEYHGGAPAWAAVEEGDPERLRSLSAAAFPILLLCYPPPSIGGGGSNKIGAACMGTDTLARFSGKVLLYIGEVGGDTGSPRMEAALRAGWDLVEEVDLPCFPSTANRLMVFTRKGSTFIPPLPVEKATLAGYQRGGAAAVAAKNAVAERLDAAAACIGAGAGAEDKSGWGKALAMYRCGGCGAAGRDKVRLHRCRLTRAVSYCSEKCLSLDAETWRANLEARHVHLAGAAAASPSASGREGAAVFRDKKLFKRLTM